MNLADQIAEHLHKHHKTKSTAVTVKGLAQYFTKYHISSIRRAMVTVAPHCEREKRASNAMGGREYWYWMPTEFKGVFDLDGYSDYTYSKDLARFNFLDGFVKNWSVTHEPFISGTRIN